MKSQPGTKKAGSVNGTVPSPLEFTKLSEEAFYDAVDLAEFRDEDAETIYQCLKSKLRLVPFCDYLKRYIYLKTGMTGDYRTIDEREYQRIIVDSFTKNNTPKSFGETSAKMGALAKNWLTQVSVSRAVVFLLGFGLNMGVDDIVGFLTKALRERAFNFKDPDEILYWYCFKNNYHYSKMLELKQQNEKQENNMGQAVDGSKTLYLLQTAETIADDQSLLLFLKSLKKENNPSFSATAEQWFFELYSKCQRRIADDYNADEEEKAERDFEFNGFSVHDTSDLSEGEKRKRIRDLRSSRKIWTSNDITEADVEKVLCSGMPVTGSGNLGKLSSSKFSKFFSSKRFSRQHIAELLSKEMAADRFDLITLNFFLFSQDEQYAQNNKKRYNAFVDSTNDILRECMMGELYITNPYECFLLMCILSDGPLATYSDVWEMSFEGKA